MELVKEYKIFQDARIQAGRLLARTNARNHTKELIWQKLLCCLSWAQTHCWCMILATHRSGNWI